MTGYVKRTVAVCNQRL